MRGGNGNGRPARTSGFAGSYGGGGTRIPCGTAASGRTSLYSPDRSAR